MLAAIDLNSDLGEGAGTDAQLMPIISSANIACGGHAGDESTMSATVALARRYGVAVGAHPGYPDRENFGRDPIAMDPDELSAEIARQIRALRAIDPDLKISHVKAHGALYNQAWHDKTIANAIVAGVRKVFTDRAYEKDGTLRSRKLPGALHTDPKLAAKQALSFTRDGGVHAHDGSFLKMAVDTLCIHGDTPGAPEIGAAVRDALIGAGVKVRAAIIWP